MPAGKHDETLRVVAPPPILFLLGLALGAGLDRLIPLAPGVRSLAAGASLATLGVALIAWAAVTFRRAGTTVLPYGKASFLVPGGPYRFTRNPMYLGMTLAYGGVALATAAVWAFLLLPAVLLVLHVGVIAREERHLEARFGDAYVAYRRAVRRWL